MRLLTFCACLALLCTTTVNSETHFGDVRRRSIKRLSNASNGTPVINVDQNPTGVLNATAWSLIYTYPLAIFASWAGGVLRNHTVNTIFHQTNLASPGDPGVIKPNVDTLYSRVVLDLSKSDVVLTVPNITDGRYWVYPVYDPFGNNQAETGVVNGNKAGNYLIRRADDVFVPPGYSNDTRTFNSSAYQGVVNLPGSCGTLTLTGQHQTCPIPPTTGPQQLSSWHTRRPSQQLQFAARIIPYTQPQIYSERYRVASILSSAGLYDGHYQPPANLNLTLAAVIANASITADVENPSIFVHRAMTGSFYVALAGYQRQTVRQTLYPGYKSLGFTSQFQLEPNQSLLVTFSGKPKLQSSGFWSLTVYGADQYLIANELNRFEVGDRTYNLTYPYGDNIYGPNANSSRDGCFQILVQPANMRPPANWTNNWLPTNKTFSWITRWYVPDAATTNGSYVSKGGECDRHQGLGMK
ncbi:hypothetical protein PV05_10543 [Exophiala xenobiotica]|uniref:DUF1254 domain-containing protein n=1 Tax=Exophiala xenobiotica TaxID=348802 RepID=A0A0D2BHT2_9EURO|nr:uncharacterized protein PV05_10543 [Exophiala xenobiotica]KIW51861.1 hypothetical protein PV05_10543 [Exophiala xenobiotica]